MVLGNGSIVIQFAGNIATENLADADHSEARAFGRAKSTHARSPENPNALGESPQDLLVPHRRHVLEETIYQADRARPVLHGPRQVAVLCRPPHLDIFWPGAMARQTRTNEQDLHARPAMARRARPPGRQCRFAFASSRSAERSFTTESATPGGVRSTAISAFILRRRSRSSI